jgi:protein TonB
MKVIAFFAAALLATLSSARAEPIAAMWETEPTPLEFNLAYPREALAAGVSGNVRLLCTIQEDRRLECAVHDETPSEMGFGAAALRLSRRYVLSADNQNPSLAAGTRVILPVAFRVEP